MTLNLFTALRGSAGGVPGWVGGPRWSPAARRPDNRGGWRGHDFSHPPAGLPGSEAAPGSPSARGVQGED